LLSSIPLSSSVSDITRSVQRVLGEPDLHSLDQLRLHLDPAQQGNKYFQCVLSPVKHAPELSALRGACERAFGIKPAEPYFPHLSLVYGELEEGRRREIAQQVNEGAGVPSSLEIVAIQIVRMEGPVEDWQVVGSVPLRGWFGR
jgi:hypothetical protein